MPAVKTPGVVVVYDPCREGHRRKAWLDKELGRCALFQRRLEDGDIQYEAHYLSVRGLQFLDALSFEQRNVIAFSLGI